MQESYQPLHHKYRPRKFDQLIGQEAITVTLKQAIKTNRIAPAYLFSGPRGTGKTSSARILARSLNCLSSKVATSDPCGKCDTCKSITNGTSLDVIEIDAASNTGVDNIRELIERSRFAPVQSRWKVYVIDECHMLSTAAFNALLKTLEEPPPNVVFVLATTDPQRVLSTILSRCQRFDFQRIGIIDLKQHLNMIALNEGIIIDPEAIEIIAQKAEGGLRDAESMLDQLSLLPSPITANNVWELVGIIPEQEIMKLTSALAQNKPIMVVESYRELLDQGRDPLLILQGLAGVLRDLVIYTAAPDRPGLLSISNEFKNELKEISSNLTLEKLIIWQSQLKGTEQQIRNSMQPRLWLEIFLLGTLAKPTNTNNVLAEPDKAENLISNSLNNQLNNKESNKEVSNISHKESEEIKIIHSKNESDQEQKINIDNNLEELWKQILGRLELPSTRMLLSQQAKLIRLNQTKAVINVAENWLGMVQSRVSILEQAIEETLGDKREIILENAINLVQDNDFSEGKGQQPNNIEKTNNSSTYLNSQSNKIKSTESKQERSNDQQNSPKIVSSQTIKPIDDGAKKIADFFNGEILDK